MANFEGLHYSALYMNCRLKVIQKVQLYLPIGTVRRGKVQLALKRTVDNRFG